MKSIAGSAPHLPRALLAFVALTFASACGASAAAPPAETPAPTGAPTSVPEGAGAVEGDEDAGDDGSGEEDPEAVAARKKQAERAARRAKLRPTIWKIRTPKKVSIFEGRPPVGITEYTDTSDETFANDETRHLRDMEGMRFHWTADEAAEALGLKRTEGGAVLGCGVAGLYTAYKLGGASVKIGFDRPVPVESDCEPGSNDEQTFGPNDVHAYDDAADVAVWVRVEGTATKTDAQKLFDAVFTK